MPELSFKGKEFVFNHHLAVPHRPLVPDASKSIGEPRLDGNLVLHGDNLHALIIIRLVARVMIFACYYQHYTSAVQAPRERKTLLSSVCVGKTTTSHVAR